MSSPTRSALQRELRRGLGDLREPLPEVLAARRVADADVAFAPRAELDARRDRDARVVEKALGHVHRAEPVLEAREHVERALGDVARPAGDLAQPLDDDVAARAELVAHLADARLVHAQRLERAVLRVR